MNEIISSGVIGRPSIEDRERVDAADDHAERRNRGGYWHNLKPGVAFAYMIGLAAASSIGLPFLL